MRLILWTLYLFLGVSNVSSASVNWKDSWKRTLDRNSNVRDDNVVFFSQDEVKSEDPVCDAVVKDYRFDCMPDSGDENLCKSRGCCWSATEYENFLDVGRKIDAPYCFFPANVPSYKVNSYAVVPGGYSLTLTRDEKSPWPSDVMKLKLEIKTETRNRMRVKLYDPANTRYEVPIEKPVVNKTEYGYLQASINHEPFSLSVTAGEDIIFDSDLIGAPLIFADQFIQWSFRLNSPHIYGLGEHKEKFLINATEGWQQRTFWAHDQAPIFEENLNGDHPFFIGLTRFEENLYGDHPFFMGLTREGAYGIFLLNSNAMDVDLQPMPALTFRTTGGILDFYFFYDTTPDGVVAQYASLIGRPAMPPMWGLGYHQCRWGYHNSSNLRDVIKRTRDLNMPYVIAEYTNLIGRPQMPPLWGLGYHQCRYGYNSADELSKVIDRTRGLDMPYEVQWSDIDYMAAHTDWTYDKKAFSQLPDIVKDLHDHDQKYVVIVDPGILPDESYAPYSTGLDMDIFIKNSSGQPLIGKVWPGDTAFPDFTHPNASDWWYQCAKSFHDQVPFDGLWTDMNEPSNFVTGSKEGCTDSNLDKPPYTPGIMGGNLADKTVCPSAKQYLSTHYNLHSMYGHFEVKVTHEVLEKLRKKRSFIISRSTFPSTGVYGGHWSGDISSTWEDLYYSIPDMLDFQMFGIPLMGADICGFAGDTTEELCTRWMQLGAFYPFMRNHNDLTSKDQDPAVWSKEAAGAMKDVVVLRYRLLPYLYTLFYHAHINGGMVARPLMFQYPHDMETWAIDRQFMWGDALLISPVLEQGATSVKAYLNANDTYYDVRFGEKMTSSGWVTLDAPLDTIPVHIRGGSIIPVRQEASTTVAQQAIPYTLIVALTNHVQPSHEPGPTRPGRHPLVSGALYADDGESIDSIESGAYNYVTFLANNNTLNSTVVHSGYDGDMKLTTVVLYGLSKVPAKAMVNDSPARVNRLPNNVVILNSFQVDLKQPMKFVWE